MDASFTTLEAHLKHLSPGERADVRRAFEFAFKAHGHELREDGTPYIFHPLAVARTLAEWGADRDTIIAALLHDVLEDTEIEKPEILQEFGRHVALLVESVTKFTTADLSPDLPLDRKIETLRKLFEVMRLDVRSILIKLADRLHNVQTIDVLPPDRRRRFALETLTVYYRIAYHLGMRDVRRSFAEAAVPYAFDDGIAIRDLRDRMCAEAATAVTAMEHFLSGGRGKDAIELVFLQPRNLFLFYERAKKQDGAPLLRDAFTVIIIVHSEEDCYHMLKTLHTRYRPISGQFRDYIASPTDAGYRGIHTFVALPDSGTVEVRIRTPEMYEQSRNGVAASLFSAGPTLAPSFAWLRRSEELDLRTRESSSAFWEALASDILQESLPVTVDGKRISLPAGATVLDAAYALYDARAHCITDIAVNDRPVALSHTLREDDDVRCTFGPAQTVTAGWLSMVSTQHARFSIVDVLKQVRRSEKITLGSRLLERELSHFGKGSVQALTRAQCAATAQHFQREGFDEVLAMVGDGTLRARDVFFDLFPERPRLRFKGLPLLEHRFRLRIVCMPISQSDVLASLHSLLRLHDITVHSMTVQMHRGNPTVLLSGSAPDRIRLADFLDMLEREEWTSSVQATLPFLLKTALVGGVLLAFLVTIADLILFPWYQSWLVSFGFFPQFFLQAFPLIPIVIATGYLLKLLSSHIAWMRSERWFLAMAFFLNFFGFLLLIFRMLSLGIFVSVFPLLVTFTAALAVIGYAFLRVESLFSPYDEYEVRPIHPSDWMALRSQKVRGYAIRVLAVCVWGLIPVYIRYTSVNDLSPLLRTFLIGVGAFVPACLFLLLVAARRRSFSTWKLPYSGPFVSLIIGQVGFQYLQNASLQYTSGTNLLLFNNFAPLIGLIIAAFLWHREIPYFREPRTMFWIFLLAAIAGIGSSLLVYYSLGTNSALTVLGDTLAMISTFFDVLLTVGQIQYIKRIPRTNGMLLNLHLFFFLMLAVAPLVLVASVVDHTFFMGLTWFTLLLGLGTGSLNCLGQFLNYEAFKRIDGFLAYIMFNLSTVITFIIEAFIFHSIRPTYLFLISAVLILTSSIVAEAIHSRCQRKGL